MSVVGLVVSSLRGVRWLDICVLMLSFKRSVLGAHWWRLHAESPLRGACRWKGGKVEGAPWIGVRDRCKV